MKRAGFAIALFALTLLAGLLLATVWPGAAATVPGVCPLETSPPLSQLPERLHGSIRSVRTGAKVLALTFDLCEGAQETAGYDEALVDYLRAHDVKATFFAGGKWLRSHPQQAMQLLADHRFEIGNHGWSHRNLRQLNGQALADEVDLAQRELTALRDRQSALACAKPAESAALAPRAESLPLFRFPYGTCNAEALAYVNARGLVAIQWDVVTGDPNRAQSAEAITRTVLREVHPGAIVVAHANGRGWHTAAALPLLIPQLRAKGYRLVTVSELLAMGEPVAVGECFERTPGDNRRYDRGKR